MEFRLLISLAAAAACTTASAQPLAASQISARILAAHNVERAALGVPPLVWDNDLAIGAAAYAQQMALTGLFAHSDRATRPGVGENLWSGTRGAFSVETMVFAWTSEKRMFSPGIFPDVSRTGNWLDVSHYTQMVWPSTNRVGCAIASTQRLDYLVCRYSPKGNKDGRRVP
jgi:hypothetical protein